MDITSDVAQGLVTGSHISAYASSRGPLLTPDLSTSDYLEDKHEALINIHSVISKTAKDINQLWQDSPLLPSPPSPLELPHQLFQHQPSSSLPFRSLASPSFIAGMITRDEMLYSSRPSGNEHASRPDSRPPLDNHTQRNDDVDDESSANEGYRPVERDGQITEPYSASIEEVRARGTGYYKCPHGLSCAKGGVHSDDTIRIFTRNSDFKYVALLPCWFEHVLRVSDPNVEA
ncbi:hypothetical protein S40293_00641 [Stachybotrys chartarum IBT 40293]|nr:hypothetical protein S40293_00641 [Stachybotrys chartarum IBT 40293]